MRKCMKCGTTYEDDCTFCTLDGERLVLVTADPPAPMPAQDQRPQQPVSPAPIPTPNQNQQSPKQGSVAGPYNYGMTVIEKVVVGVLIGIIALAIVLGILFITGVLGGK